LNWFIFDPYQFAGGTHAGPVIKSLSIVVTALATVTLALAASCDAKPPGDPRALQAGSLTPCTTKAPLAPEPTLPIPAPTAGANTGTAVMTVETNLGTIEIDVDRSKIPCTAAFIAHIGKAGMYNGTVCHRLTTEGIFVLQCGDPKDDGTGGPGFGYDTEGLPTPAPAPTPTCEPFPFPTGDGVIIYRTTWPTDFPGFPTDFPTDLPSGWTPGLPGPLDLCGGEPMPVYPDMHFGQGTVGMANSGQHGSTGSQFFFAYRDFKLPAKYTVLGHVRTGMDIINRVAADGTVDGSTDGRPRTRLVISKVTVK